ncbi:Hypothetical predicted protein [Cloeon dipterum]|uniref:Centrosome-associated protein 350 n=1 Tax=Cloeon dipterum TaxID=197152 RepID=A0A8S1C7J0_9INSE|nr:Hypothetical predicted protein [Cloeon dipterum]
MCAEETDIRQITPEVFKTAPALLSFDPASISLGLDTPPEERPKKTPTKCHQTQTEPFDFRTPSPRPAAEEQSVLREIETAAEAPPVFIGNGPPVKSDKPSKVARVLSPPTRDAPQPKPAMKTKPGVKAKFAPSLHKTKIKSSQEATVPSPEEDLFKSSIPRYLVTRAKSASKTPSPPRKIKKPEITPSTWREERERKINEKKNDEQYVDDFESEDEEDKGIHVKKKKSPKKFIFKAKSPPAPKMPEPKKRHYNPSEVKKYISQQRRQRCEEKFKVEEDKKNKEERTKQHLNELQNRTRQILQANVRQCRSSKSVEATHKSKSPLSSFAINNLQLNLHNLKSPSVSSKSSMRESNNRLSDEFIEDFVKMHQPRPARQEILSHSNRFMFEISSCIKVNLAAATIQAAFRGHLTRKRLAKERATQKAAKLSFKDQGTQHHAVPFDFLDNCIEQTQPDPFSFIQTVKRKLSEAISFAQENSVVTESGPMSTAEEENKYESDFESSVPTASPSEEIPIGSDSRPESQHSLVSVSPDKNAEINALASKENMSSLTSISSPSQLVPPNVGLVVQPDVLAGQRPTSGPEGCSASSTSTASSSTLLSQSGISGGSAGNCDFVTSYTVYKSGSKTIKVPHAKQPVSSILEPPIHEIKACFENKSIEELEASIIAGFKRLGEEMNATRALFEIPLPLMEPRKITMKKIPTLQDVLPKLTSTLENIYFTVPQLTEKAKNLAQRTSQSSPENDATEADIVDEIKDESEEFSASTITEEKKETEALSEKTSSGGLPRVMEAVKDFELSLQSAQGSLQNLAEQESLEDISEQDYSSKFEEESEIIEEIQSESDTTPTVSDVLTEINGRDRPSKLSKSKSSNSTKESLTKHSSGGSGEHDSFTVFSLTMFHQLVRDQELRARQQRALLKQREDAIYEKSKAELILLENQKKQMRIHGTENLIPGIKKRQRAILLRLNQERDEIKRLRESHKIASQERKLMLQQQHHIAKLKLAAKEIAQKLHGKDISSKRLLEPSRWAVPELSEDDSSAASISLDTSDLSHSKQSSEAESTMKDVLCGLKKREKAKRRSDGIDHSKEKSPKVPKQDAKQNIKNDLSTSPVPASVEEAPSLNIPDSVTAEETENPANQSISEKPDITEPQSPFAVEISSTNTQSKDADCSQDSLQESFLKQDQTISPQEASQAGGVKKTPITIKVPLSPRLHHNRQKRRHSSGSDESIVLSQNETASEQSDVESRICALHEQLRRRKMEAEKLRKEQKRCHRERLRAKEQSLLKQIQAYDSYIQQTRKDLEQEFENGSVKPQIKQPRVAEKTRPLKVENSELAISEINVSEQLKSVESEIKEEEQESSEIKEDISIVESEVSLVEKSIDQSVESENVKTEVEEEEVDREESSKEDTLKEDAVEPHREGESVPAEDRDLTPTPILTSENIPDIPTDHNASKVENDYTLSEEIEEAIDNETLVTISEVYEDDSAKPEAVSPVSIAGSQASVETTIESPRKTEIEEQVSTPQNEIVEEDILVQVENLRRIVDEDQVDRITDSLMKRLLDDTLRMTQVSKVVNNEQSLKEELEAITEVKEQSPERVKSISPPTSSILDRVHSLLAETGLSSPRDKTRPQDLMGLTFVDDALSPEPGFEVPGVCEEILSAASPIVIAPLTLLQKVDLQEGLKENKTEAPPKEQEAGKDDPTQEWFDEDFGLSNTRKEAEQLRLQQLQIEQEIQLLQSQQYSCYVREIPNKPPPPYTPPKDTSRSHDEESLPAVSLPNTKEEILPYVLSAAEKFYHARLAGRDFDSVQPPMTDGEDTIDTRMVYDRFLFDLGKQLVEEAYGLPDEDLPAWLEPVSTRKRKELLRPKSLQELQARVENQVKNLFGFSERKRREKLIIRWSRKRRDHVDELLVREAQEEEQAWTNYEMDEAAVKSQLVDAIFNQVLKDTVAEVQQEFQIKHGQS